MNYNDKIMSQQGMILNTQQSQFYQQQILTQSESNNKNLVKNKQTKQFFQTYTSNKGKQNQPQNVNLNFNKNIITNHSFNGFFNQNTKQFKKPLNESLQSSFDPTEVFKPNSHLQININSPTNFNSSGKLSNLQFVNDSINKSQDIIMNSQVKNFMKKYFPINYQNANYYGQYVTIQDFVEILIQDFQHLLGQNSFNLAQQFADKIFLIFGQKIYFDELIQKASQNGLTGIVFEVLKAIQQDKKPKKDFAIKQNKSLQKSNIPISPNLIRDSRLQKSKGNSGINMYKTKSSTINSEPLIIEKSNITKISLDKFFGSNISKVQFYEDSTRVQQQNLQQIKQILQDYIENMYQEAESKLNKKYTQQMKKITLKYKQTQKLMEKINQKISNYYDCIQLEKDYQKKLKSMTQKENEFDKKVKSLQYQLKISKDQIQKEKLNTFKTNQQLQKIKQKLEKYQNAIFQKAMEKSSSQLLNTAVTGQNLAPKIFNQKENINCYSQLSSSTISQKPQTVPKFQIRVDTFSEHRTDLSPHKHSISPIKTNPPTYTSYFTKQTLSPINIKKPHQIERGSSVSPIKQRISFVKTQNPVTQTKVPSPSSNKQNIYNMAQVNLNQNYPSYQTYQPVYYQTSSINSLSGSNSQQIQHKNDSTDNSRLKVSNVQKLQVGNPIHLRPLSPIGKLGQTNKSYSANLNIKTDNQRSYSPIRVQFCNSRVNTINQ